MSRGQLKIFKVVSCCCGTNLKIKLEVAAAAAANLLRGWRLLLLPTYHRRRKLASTEAGQGNIWETRRKVGGEAIWRPDGKSEKSDGNNFNLKGEVEDGRRTENSVGIKKLGEPNFYSNYFVLITLYNK